MPNFNSLALTVLEKSCSQTPKTPIFWAWRSGRLTDLNEKGTVADYSRTKHACKISLFYDQPFMRYFVHTHTHTHTHTDRPRAKNHFFGILRL
ncbi:hypothetical protein WDU94_007112 [Cyamophila willieti]